MADSSIQNVDQTLNDDALYRRKAHIKRRRHAGQIAAYIAALAGLINLFSAVFPRQQVQLGFINQLLPGEVAPTAVVVSVAAGIGLLLLADGLRRRNRNAWVATVALLVGSCISHYLKGQDVEEAIIQAFFIGYLFANRRDFDARVGPREHLGIVAPILIVIVATMIYGVVGLSVAQNDLIDYYPLEVRVAYTMLMALGFGLDPIITHRFGPHFPLSVAVLFYSGIGFAVIRILRPVLRRSKQKNPVTTEEINASGDSLGWFATRDDRIIVRNNNGAVSMGSFGKVALATGDPLGPPKHWPDAIEGFLMCARQSGLIPAVMGCGEVAANLYKKAGLIVLYMGDEAILDIKEFSVNRPGMKIARQSWNRAQRAGYTATMHRSKDLSDADKARLRSLSSSWRGDAAERGFSMALGRLFDERDGDAVFAIGWNSDNEPEGFIHFVPWGEDGLSLDVMRRDRNGPAIFNDFLLIESAMQLKSFGINRMSLNFSFLRAVLAGEFVRNSSTDANDPVLGTTQENTKPSFALRERIETVRNMLWSPSLRIMRWTLKKLSNRFQIESLYRFNKKFNPIWQPRYFVLEASGDAPRVLYEALRAEGLITVPHLRKKENSAEASGPR